jgi:hypothetical protein
MFKEFREFAMKGSVLDMTVGIIIGAVVSSFVSDVRKPSRSLTVANHGTRFPGVLRNRPRPNLRHLPTGFTLDPYFDARGHPALPMAKGLVSWVRKVDAHNCIKFNGAEYFIRRKLERQYVVATLSTYHRRVFIKYEEKVIKTFPFPFVGKVVDPIA